AKKYGARVALFGRKINNAENQLAFIHFLRLIADDAVSAEEAVRAYHGVLQELGIKPHRALADDLTLQTNVMSYDGSSSLISLPEKPTTSAEPACNCKGCACSKKATTATQGEVDFRKMTPAEKLAYHKAKWDRVLG